jgi:uncharacterized membrane protein YoaK (UPF0700 family)
VRQRRSDRFRERSLLFPLALGAYGAVLLTQTSEHDSLTTASAVLLLSSAVASISFGVIRGQTIELSCEERNCGNGPRGRRSELAGEGSW